MGSIGQSPVTVRADPKAVATLVELARERPLVMDYYASRRCGVTIGDLRARFGAPPPGTDVIELDRIASVRVLAEPNLVPILASGASVHVGRSVVGSRIAIELDRPESWLEFLEAHPARRR